MAEDEFGLKEKVSKFVKTNQTSKTMVLVRKIRDLKYIVVNTEEDALLLENNLIKKYKPRYNILLKDDKTYPWICITKEAFPRVFTTRKFIRNGSEYFGPYTSAKYANTLISLIKSLYIVESIKYAWNITSEIVWGLALGTCRKRNIWNILHRSRIF